MDDGQGFAAALAAAQGDQPATNQSLSQSEPSNTDTSDPSQLPQALTQASLPKAEPNEMTKALSEAMGEEKPFAEFTELGLKSDLQKQLPRASDRRQNLHQNHVPSEAMDLLIVTINDSDFGWKADVCKLQKHHELYGSHCGDEENIMIDAETESQSETE